MGAFQLFCIEFKNKGDRDKFEKLKIQHRRLFQYDRCDDTYECFYYMGWDNYGLGKEVISRLRKLKVKPISIHSIDLSCKGNWYDEINEVEYEEKD